MEDKKHSFMNQLNLFFIGAVIGVIVGACFGINAVKVAITEQRKSKGVRRIL